LSIAGESVKWKVLGSDRDMTVVAFFTDSPAMDKVLHGIGAQDPAAGSGSGTGGGTGSGRGSNGGGGGGGGTPPNTQRPPNPNPPIRPQ
jgi:hypothetical protein